MYLDFSHELSINTIGDLKGHRCNPDMSLNYDQIFYQGIALENDELYNCSVPFHPIFNSEKTFKPIEICHNAVTGKKAFDNFNKVESSRILSDEDKPCSRFGIFPGLPDIDVEDNNEKEAYIRLYINPKIKVKSMVIYYDATTFFGEIGGYIGLLLGVSLVDLIIMFNAGCMRLLQKKVR